MYSRSYWPVPTSGNIPGHPGASGTADAAANVPGYPGVTPGTVGAAANVPGYPGVTPGTVGAAANVPGYPGISAGGTGGAASVIPPQVPSGSAITPGGAVLPLLQEESYVENILRMNLGKVATIYMTFENNSEWNAKVFKGVLEAAGRDHIIIRDPVSGRRFLLLTVNLDYITFDEPLVYTLPFGYQQAAAPSGLTRPD